ncbi:MAG: ATP-dependent DNA helicase RecG [Rhodocyclaceae bacterium]|nr:ATP-dependent DNA helicase RecG [Rhodocyclaceae bacterium]
MPGASCKHNSAADVPPRAATSAGPPGINPAQTRLLARIGLRTLADLVLHLPLRYDDETRLSTIAEATRVLGGGAVVVECVVRDAQVRFKPRRTLVVTVDDGTGELTLRFLNFYPSQQRALEPGVRIRAVGEIRGGFIGAEMVHPRWRVLTEGTPMPDRLTPVYPTTQGLSQPVLQRLVSRAVAQADLSETLPASLLGGLGLPPFAQSLHLLHAPPADIDAAALTNRTHPAWRRMKFDELLAQQLSMRMHRNSRSSRSALPLPLAGRLARQVLATAGLDPTRAQARVLAEISADLARGQPMQRLLQGDVGSGKTLVAALAAAQAVEAGTQVAVMAPTELLAEQTFRKFEGWFAPAGVEVAWLAGSLTKKKRAAACARLAAGEASIAVGTHALFQQGVDFSKLALAIVDEQHRFGVNQRLALRGKGLDAGAASASTASPAEAHLLMMTATPIPRTLAMACYADLDVSTIDELPPGRSPIATRLVGDHRRDEVIQRVRDACMQGRQAYWVCPLIEESEALQLQTAVDTHAALCATFPELSVGLVHGRLKAAEKATTMAAFKDGALQLLVATTVIEVGVDVPNASLMVIEHAERMGLAQLHQLRGRVGRGSAKSSCILLYQTPLSPLARERLKVVFESSDGFEIARRDLELRGPGELMGARQSGLPMLRFADPVQDTDLLEAAVEAAGPLLEREPEAARRHLARWLPEALQWLNG